MRPPRVFINPGHDRDLDSGAVNVRLGLRECDVAADIGELMALYLSAAYVNVKVMQNDDLVAVCVSSNTWDSDIFVSIHCNAFDGREQDGTAHGTEVLVYSQGGESAELARAILRQVVGSLGTADRGVKERPGLMVLGGTAAPAALVECAFIDNDADGRKLRDRADEFARAIARGVTDYFQQRQEGGEQQWQS